MMRAIVFQRFGSPDVLEGAEIEKPTPGRGEVLVRVSATTFNPLDAHVRSGKLWFLTGRRFPKIAGIELAGRVEALGPGAGRHAVGDRVYGTVDILAGKPGSYAEYVCVPEEALASTPPRLDDGEAAALAVGALVSVVVLDRYAQIRPGQEVLVLGASGGVGAILVQLAKIRGARVTGVCSAAQADRVRDLGADEVIDYAKEDYRLSSRQFDLVVDLTDDGSYFRARSALAPGGAYVTTVPGPRAIAAKLWTALSRRRTFVVNLSGRPHGQTLAGLAELVGSGALRPVVGRRLPLAEVRRVHADAEAGKRSGKVVLDV